MLKLKKFKQFINEGSFKFKGTFSWYGENHTLYTTTSSEEKAFMNCCSKLAKKLNRSVSSVVNYFKGTNKYKIEKI